MKDSAIFSLS